MITEDYVSFETARLLKEKGFDEVCYLGYNKNGEYVPTSNRRNSQIIQPDFCFICCPTIQMAMDWLREEHHLWIDIDLLTSYRWTWSIWFMNDPYKKWEKLCKVFQHIKKLVKPQLSIVLKI